jgi:S1-C subfamily serine protease
MRMRLSRQIAILQSILFVSLLGFAAGQSSALADGRAWIGIDIIDIGPEQVRQLGSSFGVSVLSGTSVLWVREDSPASSAGLMRGDVIVGVDGQSVRSAEDLICSIMMRVPGSVVRLETIRGNESRAVLITLGRCPDELVLSPGHCRAGVARTSFNSSSGIALQ